VPSSVKALRHRAYITPGTGFRGPGAGTAHRATLPPPSTGVLPDPVDCLSLHPRTSPPFANDPGGNGELGMGNRRWGVGPVGVAVVPPFQRRLFLAFRSRLCLSPDPGARQPTTGNRPTHYGPRTTPFHCSEPPAARRSSVSQCVRYLSTRSMARGWSSAESSRNPAI